MKYGKMTRGELRNELKQFQNPPDSKKKWNWGKILRSLWTFLKIVVAYIDAIDGE